MSFFLYQRINDLFKLYFIFQSNQIYSFIDWWIIILWLIHNIVIWWVISWWFEDESFEWFHSIVKISFISGGLFIINVYILVCQSVKIVWKWFYFFPFKNSYSNHSNFRRCISHRRISIFILLNLIFLCYEI